MSHVATSRFLHVANGFSTTMTIEAAGIPGACSIWADPLHDGPVPGGVSDDELVAVRMRYLTGDDSGATSSRATEPEDGGNDLREWRAAIGRHTSYDELVLWYEHDVFDQLNLIQLLTWMRGHVPSSTPVSLICIGSFPGRPAFKGLGELTPEELGPLLGTRQRVGDAQYDAAERAWTAFRAPTPEPLDALRRTDTSALPYLAAAITRFLQEYPWTPDGLSRTERRLLDLASAGRNLRDAFPLMHEGEQAYYVSGESLETMAEELASTSPPLLQRHVSTEDHVRPLPGTVHLTATGAAILAGRLDRVATCGIDRWLGGVHLHGRQVEWRWDEQGRRIIKSG